MKREMDPGLQHIHKYKFETLKSPLALSNKFGKKYGDKRAEEILNGIVEDSKSGQSVDYDKKNADYEISMLFTGAYDADCYRRACNWIYKHKEAFGDTILDVGCDIGIMTTFLAGLFPEKKIVAIDRYASGIELAKINAEKLHLSNIEFIHTELADLKDRKFDTVFSMRALHENFEEEPVKDTTASYLEYGSVLSDQLQKYANELVECLKPTGNIISIERCQNNPVLYGWYLAMDKNGIGVDVDTYEEWECMELGVNIPMQSYIMTHKQQQNLIQNVIDCKSKYMSFGEPKYDGWDARLLKDLKAKKLIKGVKVVRNDGVVCQERALYSHISDATCIMMYVADGWKSYIEFNDISLKDDYMKYLQSFVKEVKNDSYYKGVIYMNE